MASAYETTNRWYNTFLSEQANEDVKANNQGWDNYTPYKQMQMYGWHPYYNEFPVVNISYDAAVAYCKWLTAKYNTLDKRKYNKVIFRLPTVEEWELASAGGRQGNMYPWGGSYTRNSKGCLLANFCMLEEQYLVNCNGGFKTPNGCEYAYPNNDYSISRDKDGVEFLGKKDNYFPNDFGLYACSGNAAEMVSQKGVSKGGSWDSPQHFLEIKSEQKYDATDATLGFRVFMQVLEQ